MKKIWKIALAGVGLLVSLLSLKFLRDWFERRGMKKQFENQKRAAEAVEKSLDLSDKAIDLATAFAQDDNKEELEKKLETTPSKAAVHGLVNKYRP